MKRHRSRARRASRRWPRHASTTASSRVYRSEAFVSPSQSPCARSFFSLPSSSFQPPSNRTTAIDDVRSAVFSHLDVHGRGRDLATCEFALISSMPSFAGRGDTSHHRDTFPFGAGPTLSVTLRAAAPAATRSTSGLILSTNKTIGLLQMAASGKIEAFIEELLKRAAYV